MTKTKLLFIGMALALVALMGAKAASAQDEQTLTADPAIVPEAGTYDFTLTGTGYTLASVNFAVCNTADLLLIEAGGAAGLMQYCGGFGTSVQADDDGVYRLTAEDVEVGEEGVGFLLFEPNPNDPEAAGVAVSIGAVEEDPPDTGEDDMAEEDTGEEDMGDDMAEGDMGDDICLLYTSPSPRDRTRSRMPSSA